MFRPRRLANRKRFSAVAAARNSRVARVQVLVVPETQREAGGGEDPNDRSPSRSLKYRLENGTTAVRREGGGREEEGGGYAVKTFRLEFRNDRRASLSGNNICTACT